MRTLLMCGLLCIASAIFAEDMPNSEMTATEEAPFEVVIENVPETETATQETQSETTVEQPTALTTATDTVTTAVVEEDVTEPEAEEIAQVYVEPNCAHTLRPPTGYDREVLMLQIFLDRYNFSCGVIDGVWGEGSQEAMQAWQRAYGRMPTLWVDVPLYADIATMPEALIQYTITSEDVALVTGAMPATWAERSQLKLMGYDSLGACIAERFHTSERTLRRLNPAILNWPEDLTIGTMLTVPNVRQAALEKPTRLVVALKSCVLAGYTDEGVMCVRFPCSVARQRAHLPEVGTLTVKNMAPAPNYTYDPANYGQDPSVGKMIIPPGPRNPVGSRWIGLSLSGYGIHGTPKPNTVGRPESRGCFRLTNWNVEKLFELVTCGMPVEVVETLNDVRPIAKTHPAETIQASSAESAPSSPTAE